MFKKLKDIITDEVRIQQFAQSAGYGGQDSNNSNKSTDQFFSISEETPHHSPAHIPSLSAAHSLPNPFNRVRRLSNSSQASDASFRLPTFDSPAVYHLSDMESASELDEAAPSPAQLGQLDLVSKEQLHQAYKRSLERYQKYRGMFTEAVRKFKEQEKELKKMRAVLVETQDKALRRISELREQCVLEQQAKAHLESSLRIDIEESKCVIKALKTKLELAKNDANLIELDPSDSSCVESGPERSSSVDVDKRIVDLEAQLKSSKLITTERDAKIIVLKEEISQLQKIVTELQAKDENNAVSMAENKMVIHAELEAKEQEVIAFKEKLVVFEKDLQKKVNETNEQQKQIENLKSQLLESRTMNAANNEVLKKKLEDLERALKLRSDEKHTLDLKVVDLEKAVFDANTEIQTLRAILQTSETEKAQLVERQEILMKQVTELQNELKSATNEINQMEQDKKQQSQNLENSKQVDDLNKQIEREIREKEELTHKVENIMTEITRLEEQLSQVRASHLQIESEKEELIKKIERLHEQHHESKNQAEQECNQKWEKQCNDLEKLVAEMKQKQIEQDEYAKNLRHQIHRLESMNEAETEAKRDAQLTLADERQKHEEAFKNLQNNYSQLEAAQNQTLMSSIADFKTRFNSLEKEKEEMEKTIASLKTDNEVVQQSQHTELVEENRRLQSLLDQIKSEKEKCISELQQKLSDIENIKQSLENDLSKSNDENTKLLDQINELSDKMANYENSSKHMKIELAQVHEETTRINSEREILLQQLESANASNKHLTESLDEQRAKMESTQRNITSLQEQKGALTETCDNLMETCDALKKENLSLRAERQQFQEKLTNLQNELDSTNNKNSIRESKLRQLIEEQKESTVALESAKACLQRLEGTNNELTDRIKELESKLVDGDEEDDNAEQLLALKAELEQLKSTQSNNNSIALSEKRLSLDYDQLKHQKEDLEDKLKTIIHEVQEVSTRNLFLEQKCENYLILEQSNERLKLTNEKLSRQLDETLVSLHHNEGLSANTEFEYLRNILFQYLSGSHGHGQTLIKVIAAVLKFTPQQTQVVMEKELQRHTLFSKFPFELSKP